MFNLTRLISFSYLTACAGFTLLVKLFFLLPLKTDNHFILRQSGLQIKLIHWEQMALKIKGLEDK